MLLWRQIQKETYTNISALCSFLELGPELRQHVLEKARFPLMVPRRLAEKMAKGTIDDPIFRQFVPLAEELRSAQGFVRDPVADATFQRQSKLLHKYQGRALLLCTGACAMNCRFCFRQNFAYDTEGKGFAEELSEIAQDTSLEEIILSGGDPLSLSNEVFGALIDGIAAISHVQRLRIHTRFPVGIPERIDDGFLEILGSMRMQGFFLIHINHPRELDADVIQACKRVQRLGIPVLSQSVLLKGVNDDVPTLKALFEAFIRCGIVPYYLNQLDRVSGAAHFEVPEEKGAAMIEQLKAQLPGYGVPRYVKEVAGLTSKLEIETGAYRQPLISEIAAIAGDGTEGEVLERADQPVLA